MRIFSIGKSAFLSVVQQSDLTGLKIRPYTQCQIWEKKNIVKRFSLLAWNGFCNDCRL